MKKTIYTTVYEDMLHQIETLSFSSISIPDLNVPDVVLQKEITDKQYGYIKIRVRCPALGYAYLRNFLEQNGVEQFKKSIRNYANANLVFTAQDIIIYRILLCHYINNQQDGIATITLDTIHNVYRGKSFQYKSKENRYDELTLNAYKKVLMKLMGVELYMSFSNTKLRSFQKYIYNGKTRFIHKFLIIKNNLDINNIQNAEIKYSLGDFGDYILKSTQYGQVMPMEIYHLQFNQIDVFNMAVYITRMIFINRRNHSPLKIYVSTLLSKMYKYRKNGINTELTYYDYLTSASLNPTKRCKIVKQLNRQLDYILELLVKNEKIQKYSYIGKFNYKFIKDKELIIKITYKKR